MKRTTLNIIAFLILLCLQSTSGSTLINQKDIIQKVESKSTLISKADIAYKSKKYSLAAIYFENNLKNRGDSTNQILVELADCYWQMRDYSNALRVYKLIQPDGNYELTQKERIRIAELYARNNEYNQAFKWLNGISGYQQKANVYNEVKSRNQMKKDSICWKLNFLNINTSCREFSPFIANNTLFFSSNKPISEKTKAFAWDGNNFARLWEIPISKIDSLTSIQITNKILNIKEATPNLRKLAEIYENSDNKPNQNSQRILINQPYHKGNTNIIGSNVKGLDKVRFNAGAISFDKNDHIYFSANYAKADKKGVNRICLMEGTYSTLGITEISQLPFGDADSYSVMHPAINQDGTLLVFSSNKANGTGGYDLYYTQRNDINQKWDSVKSFNNNINTLGNEVFPSITANNYLYYSSDAAAGLGGLDIFRIQLKDAIEGKSEPEHLSYPINSSFDDFGWTQDTKGTKGYFTSDRLNNNDNIYGFDYTSVVLPNKSFIEGFVLEKKLLNPIKGATLFIYINDDTVYIAKTDGNGKYRFPVFASSNAIIKAVDNKYISDCLTSTIVYEPQPKDTIQKVPRDLLLDKFGVGFVWKISTFHYDLNKSNIRQDAMPILDSIVMVLNAYPISVELSSHTDSRGSFAYNKRLSQHRADAAVAYIISKGIDAKRISAKGYGESRLLNKCVVGVPCSEEEHQTNRRTEVKVTGFTTPQVIQNNIDADKLKDGDIIDKSLLPKDFFDECK